ncbi:hypothetical protein EMPS_07808 [Entomortierella parvispora]|uniref:Uncharacterized protein n=1 Tax=Entomortierella parvispora TaxID=205924 RepID=A0A9P3HEU6_9FUNG|nr:hypothetical protein EMPS_07808 [Entomortierella parvispora]
MRSLLANTSLFAVCILANIFGVYFCEQAPFFGRTPERTQLHRTGSKPSTCIASRSHVLQMREILLLSKSIMQEMPAHWDSDDDDDNDGDNNGESYEKSGYSTPPRRQINLPALLSSPTTKK